MNLFDFSDSVGWLMWIPICPLIAGVVLALFKPSGKVSALVAIAALAVSLGFSLKAFAGTWGHEAHNPDDLLSTMTSDSPTEGDSEGATDILPPLSEGSEDDDKDPNDLTVDDFR